MGNRVPLPDRYQNKADEIEEDKTRDKHDSDRPAYSYMIEYYHFEQSYPDFLTSQSKTCCNANISVAEFQKSQLPERVMTDEVFNFLKNAAVTVCRVCVSSTSNRRKRDNKYNLLRDVLEKDNKRYASGWACPISPRDTEVRIDIEVATDDLISEEKEWLIRIITARHVVYDNSEAKNTEATFFYDGSDLSQEAVAKGVCVQHFENERDFAILECVTRHKPLAQRLNETFEKLTSVNFNLSFESTLSLANKTNADNDMTVVVISHPHGGSKQLTFGSCLCIEEHDLEFDMTTGEKCKGKTKYTYDAPSCPGSSGAPLIILGKPGTRYYWTPHCYKNKDGHGVSATGLTMW